MPNRDTIARVISDTDGAAGVEFALMSPALILFMIGIVDVGSLAYQKAEVVTAANVGALYAIHYGAGNLANIGTAVANATPLAVTANPSPTKNYYCDAGGALTQVVSPSSTCSGGTVGSYVVVNAQASYSPLIAFGTLSFPVTLSAQSMIRVQ